MSDANSTNTNEQKKAEFDQLSKTQNNSISNANPELDLIMDIEVSLALEVGKTKISIRDLLQLNQGSVVELDRIAGEPLDVLVNGTLIAHGEVVVINDKFGIRFTEVVNAKEKLDKIKESA